MITLPPAIPREEFVDQLSLVTLVLESFTDQLLRSCNCQPRNLAAHISQNLFALFLGFSPSGFTDFFSESVSASERISRNSCFSLIDRFAILLLFFGFRFGNNFLRFFSAFARASPPAILRIL